MSLRDQAWWPEFCNRLRTEPMEQLARAYGQSYQALSVALNLADDGGPATEAAWWPEAVRRYQGGASLREISRLFGVNLRRLRRALARAGLRVSGEDLDDEGVPALVAMRDQLGKLPDGVIAERAGVPVEAVQGERRRLNVPAYRNVKGGEEEPAPAPALAPAPAPAPAPVKESRPAEPAPRASRVAAEQPATPIRRVVFTATAQSAPPADSRAPAMTRREEFRRGGRDWREEPTRAAPTVVSRNTFRRETPSEPTVVRRPSSGGRLSSLARGELPPTEDMGGGRSEAQGEDLDSLTGGANVNRERRGRLRLIRPDAITPEPEPTPEAPKPRKRKEPSYSPVRMVSPDAVDLSELAPATPPVELRAEDDRPARPAPEPEPVEELAPLPPMLDSLPPEPAALPPRAPLVLPPEEEEDLEPIVVKPARSSRSRAARPAPSPVAAPPAAQPVAAASPPAQVSRPAPVALAAAPPPSGARGWLVRVEGRATPLVILAADILSATRRAAQELGPEELRSASIVAIGVL